MLEAAKVEAPPSQSRVEGETEQTLLAKSGLQLEDREKGENLVKRRDHAAQEKGKEKMKEREEEENLTMRRKEAAQLKEKKLSKRRGEPVQMKDKEENLSKRRKKAAKEKEKEEPGWNRSDSSVPAGWSSRLAGRRRLVRDSGGTVYRSVRAALESLVHWTTGCINNGRHTSSTSSVQQVRYKTEIFSFFSWPMLQVKLSSASLKPWHISPAEESSLKLPGVPSTRSEGRWRGR